MFYIYVNFALVWAIFCLARWLDGIEMKELKFQINDLRTRHEKLVNSLIKRD